MCGIVGYISNNDKLYEGPKDHFMRYALALDTLRGDDSTGLITISKRFTVKTLRTTMAGDQFVHSTEYKKKFRPGWASVGHNRAATRGGISLENVHPFTFGDISMVHNGTLAGGGDSLSTFDKSIGPVDSMQIAYALSKYPPDKAAEVLEQIDGSFALVWSDRRDESINMARNSERPLHFTFNIPKSILWYMSDGHHLHSINKSFGSHECKGQSIFEMDSKKILKFQKGCTQPEVIKFTPFVRTYGNSVASGTGQSSKKKQTTKPGGNDKKNETALERATSKWKRDLELNSTPKETSGSASIVKVELQGRRRKVPDCMQQALAAEMYLSPDNLLQFEPDDAVELNNGNYEVYGMMMHEDWSGTPWEMTIHNVPKIQYRAYKGVDWLVRPIGLCPAHEFDKRNCAVLGHLIHCDWESYAADQRRENGDSNSSDDDKEGDSLGDSSLTQMTEDMAKDSGILVPGPNGCMIRFSKLRNMLDAGCINCGMELEEDKLKEMLEVNNAMDLICGDCVREVQQQLVGTHTTN